MNVRDGDFVKTTELVRAVVEARFGKLDVSGFASVVAACVPLFGSYVDGEWVSARRVGGELCGGGLSRDFGRWFGSGGVAAAGSGLGSGAGSGLFGRTCETGSERGVAGDVGSGGVKVGTVLPGFAPRGPNYERNRADRERKRLKKQERGERAQEVVELEERLHRATLESRLATLEQKRGRFAAVEKLNGARLDRALADEQQRAARTAAGLDHVTEALRLAKEAVEAAELAKYKPVANVAGWAATVASSGAESIARTSTSGVSLKSVSSAASAAALSAAKGPLNVVERLLIENGVTGEKVIRSARAKVGRPLGLDDVFRDDAPFRMGSSVRREIALAGAGLPKEDQPFYG